MLRIFDEIMRAEINSHQNRVIKETLRFIAKSRSVEYEIFDYPDEKERKLPACDALALIDGKKFAIEHTSIDSVPFQRRDNSRFMALLGPLEKELTGKLPMPGHFQLIVDMGVIPSGIKWDIVRSQIHVWCQKVAPRLEIGSPSVAPRHFVREKIAGIPFEVALYRWPRRNGEFRIARFMPHNLEDKRVEVVLQSLASRGVKVSEYKDRGFRTMLILESNDIALGNASDIGQAFVNAIHRGNLRKIPEEVYLVETEMAPYYFHCLKIDEVLFPKAGENI